MPRVLPEGLSARIDCAAWELPPVFKWLIEAGNLKPSDMATTLNAGIGMVVVAGAEHKDALIEKLKGHNVFFLARRQLNNQEVIYCSAKVPQAQLLLELTMSVGVPGVKCCLKTSQTVSRAQRYNY